MLRINAAWCKGCAICVVFCPRKALGMKHEKVVLSDPDACVRCALCELRCPDYAIFVDTEEVAK
ncbi:MAG: 4Fe-4S binding protein [Defluviitaleaceae bacterium]|nr:4Fe-4S binding protein [Defluviitaleaceae bacterium]MCL2835721.1 4Fe-4S binding protein [Defluviitaleaceae bacterium]